MRYLILALLLTGCAHPARASSGTVRPAEDPTASRARALVRARFTEPGTRVVAVEASAAPDAPVYDFACTFKRAEFGKTCTYVAKGQLDAASKAFRFSHRVTTCVTAAD